MSETDIQDDLDDIFEKLSGYVDSELGSDLIIVRENSDYDEDDDDADDREYYEFGRANIDSDTAVNLMKLFKNSIKPIKNNLEDDEKELDGVEFEFSNKNRDKYLVQHLELSDIGNSNRYEQLQEYSFDGEDSFEKMTGIKFIIICIKDTQNDTVTAGFQTFSKSQILSVDDRVLLSKFSQTLANDEEPTYSSDFSDALYDIPQRIDVLYHDGELYVFNQSRFERIFGHYR
jgi:hypothetical protein